MTTWNHKTEAEIQLSLLDLPPLKRKLTPQERFEDFDRKNDWIYKTLRRRALRLKAAQFKKYSVRTLWESLRWELDRQAVCGHPYKLNNNFPPFYARKLMRENPSLREFFELRERKVK